MQEACLHDPGMTCVSTYPPIFTQAKSKTNMLPDTQGVAQQMGEITAGGNIPISARVNADLGLAGSGPEAWKWEWRDKDMLKK